MSVENSQATIFGTPSGENIEIETSGRTIRPAMEIPAALVSEAKLAFTCDGFSILTVDPSNVGMVAFDIHAEAFDTYELENDQTIGCNIDTLQKYLSNARLGKRTNDPVTLDFDRTRTLVTVDRDYGETHLSQTNEMLNLDPDSIRETPEMPSISSINWRANLDADAFHDAVMGLDKSHDYIQVFESDGHLLFGGAAQSDDSPGEYGAVADFGEVAEPMTDDAEHGALSNLSMDYMKDFAKALKKAKVNSLAIEWGQQLPVKLHFARLVDGEENATAYEGTYLLAPRVTGDSE